MYVYKNAPSLYERKKPIKYIGFSSAAVTKTERFMTEYGGASKGNEKQINKITE